MSLSKINATEWLLSGVRLKDGSAYLGKDGKLYLDADHDTYIQVAEDNIIDIYVCGAKEFSIKPNELLLEANSKITADGNNVSVFSPMGIPVQLDNDGTVTVNQYLTQWNCTTSANATLDNGKAVNQLVKVVLTALPEGLDDSVLTPDNLDGYSSVLFSKPGDFAEFAWSGEAWVLRDKGNYVDGSAGPLLT